MIEPNGKGGVAHYTYGLCSALTGQGLEVTLITSADYELSCLRIPFSLRRLFGGYSLEENVWVRGLKYVLSTWALLRTIKRERPTLLHYQWLKIPIFDLLLILVVKSLGVATVYTAHNVLPHKERFYHKWVFREIYKNVDKIVVHSNNDREKILEVCLKCRERIHVIFHGNYMFFFDEFPITQTEARSALSLAEDAKVALFFGPIAKYKGLKYLLRAFPRVIREFPSAVVLIAGRPSSDFGDYERLISELELTSNVLVDGRYIPMADVSSYFVSADVAVTPYLTTYQSGIVQMAYAFGVPVIATAVGGLPEVVQDGRTGYLVPPRDEEALADAIMRVFSDREASREMGRNGRDLAQTAFSWERIAGETAKMYRSLYA